MALASSWVRVATAPEPSRTPLLLMLPGRTMIRLLPMLWIWSCMRAVAPAPTPTIAITAATPMMMPSMVSAERALIHLQRPQRDPEACEELIHAAANSSGCSAGSCSRSFRASRGFAIASSFCSLAIFEVDVPVGIDSRHRDHA